MGYTGVSTPITITLKNTSGGGLSLTLSAAPSVSGSGFGLASGGTCTSGLVLTNGATCTAKVYFKPTSLGAKTGTLTFKHNGTIFSTTTVELKGTGIGLAEVDPASHNYGNVNVGNGTYKTFWLINKYSGNVNLAAAPTVSGSGFTVATPLVLIPAGTKCASGVTLNVGGKCWTSVRFAPTTAGSKSGTLSFKLTNSSFNTTIAAGVSGTGVAAAPAVPVASVSPASHNFGNVTVGQSSANQTITLTNTGTSALNINSAPLSASSHFDAVSNNCVGSSLAAGAKCQVVVRFTPGSAGAKSATLTFNHNASPSSTTVNLSGTGVSASDPGPGPGEGSSTMFIIEYRHKDFDYYFMTSRPAEQDLLDSLPFFERTGQSFKVYADDDSGRKGITRYFFAEVARNQQRGTHFYTLLDTDIEMLNGLNPDNVQTPRLPYNEGIDAYAVPPVVSGVGGYCAPSLKAVYRAFRGNERFPDDPNHRFTTSAALYNELVAAGWTGEGVNFCVPN